MQTHRPYHVYFNEECGSLRLGAGRGCGEGGEGLLESAIEVSSLSQWCCILASLTFLSPLLPLCLFVLYFFFLFLPLPPISQLQPTPLSKQKYGSRIPSSTTLFSPFPISALLPTRDWRTGVTWIACCFSTRDFLYLPTPPFSLDILILRPSPVSQCTSCCKCIVIRGPSERD